jgi:hypothetical protein
MGAFTMAGSTFLNAQQVDYDEFHRETLDVVAYVRAHPQDTGRSQETGRSPDMTAHA